MSIAIFSTFYEDRSNNTVSLVIRETEECDLEHLHSLWADGDVMKFVGFPEGIIRTSEEMKTWLSGIKVKRPLANHYSIYDKGMYCGESFYCIDREHNNLATLDIKLFKHARGKGIGEKGLRFAIEQAFKHGAAKVFVDPNPKNVKAIALYKKLGFVQAEYPPHLQQQAAKYGALYMELVQGSKKLF